MSYAITLVVGVVLGLALRGLPFYWRKARRAQAAQKPEYADGQWFADTTPTPAPSQAQIADAPVLNRTSLRSIPGRRPVRRNGR